MQVTSKGIYKFHTTVLKDTDVGGQTVKVPVVTQSFTVNPTPPGGVVTAPDWVRDNDLFKLAVKSGNMQEVVAVNPVAPVDPPVAPAASGLQGKADTAQTKADAAQDVADAIKGKGKGAAQAKADDAQDKADSAQGKADAATK